MTAMTEEINITRGSSRYKSSLAIVLKKMDELIYKYPEANISKKQYESQLNELWNVGDYTGVVELFGNIISELESHGIYETVPPIVEKLCARAMDEDLKYKESDISDEQLRKEVIESEEYDYLKAVLLDYQGDDTPIYKHDTDQQIPYKHLKLMMKEIYYEADKTVWVHSNNIKLHGRVVAEIDSKKKKIPLIAVRKRKTAEGIEYELLTMDEILLYNTIKLENITYGDYFIYQFETNEKRYTLLSEEKLDTKKYTIVGMKVELADKQKLGDELKLPFSSEVIFVDKTEPYISSLYIHSFQELVNDWDHDYMAKKLFGRYRHPRWFEQLIMAHLFSYRQFSYPLHLMIFAEEGTGKTKLLKNINRAMGEYEDLVSAGGSTFKGLVPSFATVPPQTGQLVKYDRVCGIDEFMDIFNTKYNHGDYKIFDEARMLNTILEHQRVSMSGRGTSITVNMSARVIGVANKVKGVKDIVSFHERIDKAFASRFFTYFQTKEHVEFVQKHQILEDHTVEEWKEGIEVVEYFNNVNVEGIDYGRVRQIIEKYEKNVPEYILTSYKARYTHHLLTLLSGIVKYNVIINKRADFTIQDEDYQLAEDIFSMVLSSWGESIEFDKLPPRLKISYLTEPEFEVYNIIDRTHKIRKPDLVKAYGRSDYEGIIAKLLTYELIKEIMHNNEIWYVPYWYNRLDTFKPKWDHNTNDTNLGVYDGKTLADKISNIFNKLANENDEIDASKLYTILNKEEIDKAEHEGLIFVNRSGKYKRV